jgi:dienelactone hydrolase
MKQLIALCIALLVSCNMIHAKVVLKEIPYKAGDTDMLGYLAYDDAITDKRPGVAVVHEWWGNNDYAKMRAQKLAELGYVAFAVDMFGKGKITDDPKQAGEWAGTVKNNPDIARQRMTAGLEILKQQPKSDPEKIAAIGYCFGGTVVLHSARANRPLKGVVSFHGDLSTVRPATKKPQAKILVCAGAADPMVPKEQVDTFRKEMESAGADFKIIEYPDAQHSFTNPKADSHNIPGVKYNEAADTKSWEDMKAFFKDVLGM